MPEINDLISYLTAPHFDGWLAAIRILFIVVFLFLLFCLFYFISKTSWLKFIFLQDAVETLTYRPYGVRKIIKQWNKIVARLETGLESESKLAVIEADSMLGEILKKMGFAGQTLGERLEKLSSATLPNIEEIKAAHQIRNNIVYDPDYRLSLDEAQKALTIYEKALSDLQAL